MSSKEDVKKYPVWLYRNGGLLIKINEPITSWNTLYVHCHHYIPQQFIRKYPEKYKEIEHLQKLFILPAEMHADLHAGCRRFKEKWGIEREELLYKLRRINANK